MAEVTNIIDFPTTTDNAEQPEQDFEKAFLRARRTLRHLWHITCGDKDYDPTRCDGCKEIRSFLTDPEYRGDVYYPVGVHPNPLGPELDPEAALGPNWIVEPGEMERPPGGEVLLFPRAV